MMEYTEPIYKRDADDYMCRVLDNIKIFIDGNVVDAVLTVDASGSKIAYPISVFENDFYLFNIGESPAATHARMQRGGT